MIDDQGARAMEFQALVEKHFSSVDIDRMLAKARLQPITAEEWHNAREKWLYSTCLPGRILPCLLFGPRGKDHPGYVPIEKRLVLS